jgi:hypothetical protein
MINNHSNPTSAHRTVANLDRRQWRNTWLMGMAEWTGNSAVSGVTYDPLWGHVRAEGVPVLPSRPALGRLARALSRRASCKTRYHRH